MAYKTLVQAVQQGKVSEQQLDVSLKRLFMIRFRLGMFDAPSSVKSLAYGALGLERPEMQATDTNGFYTAGKWMAAAVTIGGIVSLFV